MVQESKIGIYKMYILDIKHIGTQIFWKSLIQPFVVKGQKHETWKTVKWSFITIVI